LRARGLTLRARRRDQVPLSRFRISSTCNSCRSGRVGNRWTSAAAMVRLT
jgi:hypothetical protein